MEKKTHDEPLFILVSRLQRAAPSAFFWPWDSEINPLNLSVLDMF